VGTGGRNQHFVLYAATLLENESGATAILSAGSDGIDGNSSFAGAVVDDNFLREPGLREAALDALRRFDSATFLSERGATIATGPTGHNLRDLRLLLAE
jgi:hydroxypyruvate reductase